jgi:hypothetical protein
LEFFVLASSTFIGTEVYYNENFSTKYVCDGTGEDKKGANKWPEMEDDTVAVAESVPEAVAESVAGAVIGGVAGAVAGAVEGVDTAARTAVTEKDLVVKGIRYHRHYMGLPIGEPTCGDPNHYVQEPNPEPINPDDEI